MVICQSCKKEIQKANWEKHKNQCLPKKGKGKSKSKHSKHSNQNELNDSRFDPLVERNAERKLDGSYGTHNIRDKGQFGSHSVYDNLGDESKP